MKRIVAMVAALLLLAGCGAVSEGPVTKEAATTEAITTEPATTQTTTATAALLPAPARNLASTAFQKEDIDIMQQSFETVRDYVERFPAKWYYLSVWGTDGSVHVEFLDHMPQETDEWGRLIRRPFLRLESKFVAGYSYNEDPSVGFMQELTEVILDTQMHIKGFHFTQANMGLALPRGIDIGDPAQKIFNTYPDHRGSERENALYDITELYPDAMPEWGDWDGEGWKEYGFLGGRVMEDAVRFIFMEPPWSWDERARDYPWVNMYNPRWVFSYLVEDEIITGIEFSLSYHPN